jgi:shikimate dehydrogenase
MIRACVIGWPVAHSRSPLIHGYWLDKYQIEGSYTKIEVRPEEAVAFLKSLRERGFAGCNVTLPHKETAYAVADERLSPARATGAANTLWYEGGKLVADNTDTAGFMNHLEACAAGWRKDRPVSVLGAGGAARAIIHGLLEAGVREVRLFNRRRERAEAVAGHFGPRVHVFAWNERVTKSRDCGLLVNATSLGMQEAEPLDMDVAGLSAECVVADVVYVPAVTALLAAARARGLRTVDGVGMLLHQAVPGFERWFGVRPQVGEELRAIVIADIKERQC